MSRVFASGSSESLSSGNAIVSGYPFSFACWFYITSDGDNNLLMSIGNGAGTTYHGLNADMADPGDVLDCRTFDGVGSGEAKSSSAVSLNTWHHGVGVWAAADDRTVYLDGGNSGTDSNSRDTARNNTTIGVSADSTPFGYTDGRVAEAAIWGVALAVADALMLAAGMSPLMVQPEDLLLYMPLVRDNDDDLIGGLAFAAGGTPTVGDHPRIRYPSLPMLGYVAAGEVEPPAGIVVLRRRRSG